MGKKKIKSVTNEEYLKNSGSCPVCKGNQVEGDSVDIDGNEARQAVSCLDCDADWIDVYTLSRYELCE